MAVEAHVLDSEEVAADRFARMSDSARLDIRQAGEFLGQARDQAKPLSIRRVRQLVDEGRFQVERLGDAPSAPFMIRLGVLRKFKKTWNRQGGRPARSEYDFDALPDGAKVHSARAAARYLHTHHVYVGESALAGTEDPRNPHLLHGSRATHRRGVVWVFTMGELRRFKRVLDTEGRDILQQARHVQRDRDDDATAAPRRGRKEVATTDKT